MSGLMTYDDLTGLIEEDNATTVNPFKVIESELGITEEAFVKWQDANLEAEAFMSALAPSEEVLRAIAFAALRLGHMIARKQAEVSV